MAREYSVEEIRALVATDLRWMEQAIVALHNKQTADEQRVKYTRYLNSQGFNATDAEILSSFAEQIKRGRVLSEKQRAIAAKKLPKYARQLWKIAYGDK